MNCVGFTWSYHIKLKSLCKRFRARLKKLKHLKGLVKILYKQFILKASFLVLLILSLFGDPLIVSRPSRIFIFVQLDLSTT